MPRTRAQAADPTALDLPYISTTYDVPEGDIQTLLDAPTTDLIRDFLASLTAKGQDYDTLKADKLKVDVELENTVRTCETKVKAQKAQVTKHVKEVEELRGKLNEAEAARESLASEVEQLRSSTSGNSAETQTLRQRVETLEASNRDALALVESKSTEKDRVATELSEQHGKLLTLRREISQLEERNQTLENAASSQKFKEQSLQQEIDLLKRNNEWHSNELQTRQQEHGKFRKERNARIASLQRELEDSQAAVSTLQTTERTLRQRLDEVQGKADEAFSRIATLQEEASRKEQDFRKELDATKRLAELQAQNAATHKARLQVVEMQVDQIKEDAADEIGRLQAEVETERADKSQAENKVAELELVVERLESQPRASRPGTPMRNGAFDPATPSRLGSRAGSPSGAMPGSLRKTVNGLSFTQVYTQLTEAQQELEGERRRTNKLTKAMDELITEMEGRAPELSELRNDQERLEQEVLNFSAMLDEANQTRDGAIKEVQHYQSEAAAAAKEGDILRQQLRDLSAQVKILLVELQSREQGLGEMSAQERMELERAARGELTDGALEQMTDTGRFIAERLVIFHNVSELQEKNQQMIRLTEVLGNQLEGEEAQEKERQSAAYASENEELRAQVTRLKDELHTTVTQIDSYMKERDMFRRMLQHRGQLPPGAGESDLQSMFGQSAGQPATPARGSQMEPPTPRSKDVEDLNKILKEQQSFFDVYRNESATDRQQLKSQVDSLAREKSTFQADLARAQSQLTLAGERYEMLQGNLNAMRNENSELQKRSRELAENAAKQDLRTQQVAEELVEARSMAESLRNESANGKAEKELWKRIESRLTEDNKSLMDERSRLNKLVTDLQNLQNERELADSETRRRLQSRTEALESELADSKRKLEHEVEESKKVALRREYEESQSRTRIDDLVKSLGNVREELVAAKITRDQLQGRVDEMKIELRAAEEKAAALQPRPTPRAEPQQGQTNGETEQEELSPEQRLAVEVSELKRDLELARNELEAARGQVEQYRSIAQVSEEELANFNETSDQYHEETDRVISEKDAKIKELEQKIEDLTSELTTSNNETSELRTKADEVTRALDEQKAHFDAELVRLRDDAERYAEEKKLYQEDLKAQADIAQAAQQSYEDELVKHAEAAKNLQTTRGEYNELRTEVASIRAEAEAARSNLERGEESWSEQKERYERELEEAKRRREDVDNQNKLLHQQMDDFSKDLNTLRQGRNLPSGNNDDDEATAGSPSRGAENLQEVIRFLRREKEIVDVQYELSIQEAKRLQQQLDWANSQLENERQKLAEEHRRSTEKTASESSINKYSESLNQINLLRDSNAQQRQISEQTQQKLNEKSREFERLVAEMEPLKSRVGDLEGDLEGKDGELKLLQSDRDHWRERTQNIISKYDRVDPAELESLKTQLEELKAEKERLEAEQAPLREQIAGEESRVAEALKAKETVLANFKNQAKEQNRKQNDQKRELTQERDGLRVELDGLKAELEQIKSALSEAENKLAEKASGEDEEGEVREESEQSKSDEHAALHARIAEAEGHASEHAGRAEDLAGQVTTLQARVTELEGQVSELQQQLETVQENAGEVQPQQTEGTDSEMREKLRQDLATAQQEVESLRTSAANNDSPPEQTATESEPTVDGKKTHTAAQVTAEVEKLRIEMTAQHEVAMQQLRDENVQRIEKMKGNLQRQLKDGKEKLAVELTIRHSEEVQKLEEEHKTAINKLKEAHQAELERLNRDGAAAVQKTEGSDPAGTIIKPEEGTDMATLDLTNEQVNQLLQKNPRARTILMNNIRNGVGRDTEKLTKTIAEKDEEIAKLKETQGTATTDGGNEDLGKQLEAVKSERDELAKQLEAAEKDKELAVQQATETAEKKAKVQISMRDMANAKVNVVKKAAEETPDKPVKEVWEVAAKARPMPAKPTALPGSAPAAPSPGGAAPKPTVPASPTQAPSQTQARPPQSPAMQQTPEQIEQAKLRARQERFGGQSPANVPAQASPKTSTFGQPSAPPATTATGAFGQPSQPGALAQPARRPSGQQPSTGTPPNPQAAAFTPASDGNARPAVGTGPAAIRGLSTGIPRGGSTLPRAGGASGRGGISIQGAATQQGGVSQRGALQSGLPRGGSNVGRGGRGGPAGGAPRGGAAAANAGQKRPHDGEGGAGDGKRTRGGGPGASG